jgi:acetyl-CoA/propionyl-CoA carboxylase, biotin carboxylase, biotin carboxyl carrier protein
MSDAIGPGEAGRQLGVSTRTVQRWLRDGRLPAVRVGSRLKVAAGGMTGGAGLTTAGRRARESDIRPIRRLLVANRGELVVRIARTCRRLGVVCLALVAEDQARAWWTSAADELVPLRGSYLDADAVLDAARRAAADAIHPGYGFLAESATFAEAVERAGLRWVGPGASAMRALGDKQQARRAAAEVGVPVVPGYDGDGQSDAALASAANDIGYPLLVKPSAGGGGKGMHVVASADELAATLATARREARAAFGDERLILERYLGRARHVEVQLLCDARGGAVHLGERECSLQRRHQKVVEEAPSPAVDAALRKRLGDAALSLARAAGYVGAGTAEFLLDGRGGFYFLELNARLQVEHPVTEMITGRDLVADQLRIAAGERLGFDQADVRFAGHAIEARLYAEDPWHEFLPSAGPVADVRWPDGDGLRVDAGVGNDDVIGTRYDPLLAKLIASGPDRAVALDRLRAAIDSTSVLGLTTNRGFLRWLLERPDVTAGELDTELIDREWQPDADGLPDDVWSIAARAVRDQIRPAAARAGFRVNGPASLHIEIEGETRQVAMAEGTATLEHWVDDEGDAVLDIDGRAVRARIAPAPTPDAASRHAAHTGSSVAVVKSPMPGAVLEVRVSVDDAVTAGQVLLVLEAMKMENAVTAPAAGRVTAVLVELGQQVQRGEPLVELA